MNEWMSWFDVKFGEEILYASRAYCVACSSAAYATLANKQNNAGKAHSRGETKHLRDLLLPEFHRDTPAWKKKKKRRKNSFYRAMRVGVPDGRNECFTRNRGVIYATRNSQPKAVVDVAVCQILTVAQTNTTSKPEEIKNQKKNRSPK